MIEIPMVHPKAPPKIVPVALVNGEIVETQDGDLVRREDHKLLVGFYKHYWNYEKTDVFNNMSRTLAAEVESRIALIEKVKSLRAEVKKLKSELKRDPDSLENMVKQVLTKLDKVAK